MLQITTFELRTREKEANIFLAAHKPQEVKLQDNRATIFYEDGTYPVSYEVADLRELLQNVKAAMLQQNVAKAVREKERERVNLVKNAKKDDEFTGQINQVAQAIDLQQAKAAYLKFRIAELRAGTEGKRARQKRRRQKARASGVLRLHRDRRRHRQLAPSGASLN